jgi:S1-C subfamily serine protease
MKKSLLFALLFSSCLKADEVTWTLDHETAVQESLTALAKTLPRQTALIGRTSVLDTRVAVVINRDGHLLAPMIPAVDKSDAPYLLYRPDGSRVSLKLIKEVPKRFVALLKMENPPADLLPVRVAQMRSHTVVVPTSAPIASLGETASLFVDHLQFPPLEEATTFRLDGFFYASGTPVLDLSGALIGTTLKMRTSYTPTLMLANLIGDLPELGQILSEMTPSKLPNLPKAPELTKEEIKELTESPITSARESLLQSTHSRNAPCVLISNVGAQATHSVIGTIVRPNGLILTKASELGPSLNVRFKGRTYPAVLLGTDEMTDLALVGIEATNLPVVEWFDPPPASGATVASPILLQETTEDMVAEPTSYAGSFSHLLKANLPPIHATSQVTSLGLTTEQIDSRLTVAALVPETPAYESGLSPGDVISRIDGKEIKSRADLTTFLNGSEVGQEISVEVARGETISKFPVKLISPRLIPPATGFALTNNEMAMIPSVRRAPFPDAFVHTTPLNAWDCGSPLFDLNGRAIGLNIAALSPARSLALPPAVVREALDRLLAKTRTF